MIDRLVLTALDGLLASKGPGDELAGDEVAGDETISQLRAAIARLQAEGADVAIFTDRDRAEVEPIRQQLGIAGPFITESGSAIFTPTGRNPFEPALGELDGAYYIEEFGCPYVQARAGLRVIANTISHPLKGFGDFTVDKLQRVTGLSEEAAHRAKAREFSEPFMTPKAVAPAVLRQAAEEMGFGLVWRSPEEGRFSELVGAGAGLGPTVGAAIAAYQTQLAAGQSLKVLGISSRPQDLAELATVIQAADRPLAWRGVLLAEGDADATDLPAGTAISSETGPTGWVSAVSDFMT